MLLCYYCFSEASRPVDSVINKQQSHQQQIKQLHSLLEKTRADLAVEKNAVALSNKEAAKLRVLLKVRVITSFGIPMILV